MKRTFAVLSFVVLTISLASAQRAAGKAQQQSSKKQIRDRRHQQPKPARASPGLRRRIGLRLGLRKFQRQSVCSRLSGHVTR